VNRPILVAPDKFKGTFSAADAAAAIGRGLMAAGIEEIDLLPISDGGEGTMEALVRAGRGRIATAEVTGPLGDPVIGAFGLLDDGKTAVVETAQASGLWRVPPGKRDALAAAPRGPGERGAAAVEAGAGEVSATAGGSATTDGGRGALEALGARFKKTKADLDDLLARLRRV
jgi:glycerate kinase